MPDKERQDTLSEIVVREAIGKGMDSPMRDTIVEAVEEAEGPRSRLRTLPLAGALLGAGAAFGYLLGLQSREGELEDIETPEVVAEALEEGVEGVAGEEASTTESDEGGSRVLRLAVVVAAAVAGVALARRFRSGEEEWEPIDEFETAVGEEEGGETEGVADEEAEEAESEETEEGEETEEAEETEE